MILRCTNVKNIFFIKKTPFPTKKMNVRYKTRFLNFRFKLNIQTKTIGLCVNNTLKIDKDGFDI